MQNILQSINQDLEGVVLRGFTEEQKVLFKNNYNCKLYFFEYGLSPGGDLVVNTSKNNYQNLHYYMGFDPSKNNLLKLKIELEENVVVIYNMENERVSQLAKKLGLVS